jgi:hypothetical protein
MLVQAWGDHINAALLPAHHQHAHTHPPHAGQRRVPGHIRIPKLMKRPRRLHADKPKSRSLVLAVAVCLAGGVYIKEMTSSSYDGMQPLKAYYNKRHQQLQRYGGEEYSDFLQEARAYFMRKGEFRRQSQNALLFHDRSKAHTAKVVSQTLEQMQLASRLLPPRSPDMMPLDYGIFSTSKARLAREREARASWTKRVMTFKDLIRRAPIEASIRQLVVRLRACINVGGQHIDEKLERLEDGA